MRLRDERVVTTAALHLCAQLGLITASLALFQVAFAIHQHDRSEWLVGILLLVVSVATLAAGSPALPRIS